MYDAGPRAPTPQRCSAGCSVYRKCVLEGSAASHHGVSTLESNHHDVAGRNRIRQSTQCRSIPLSMSAVHHTIGGANACGFQSRVNEEMELLRTFHFAASGVEWYDRSPNDV
ncbi:hypothetical protein TNCV_4698701 [Trichonephila clavipes]|nr:hypothetical protein TNCV_4698701 [Trichonephila clavipes]